MTPGRRTNRKNLRNCQRTIMVLHVLNFGSTEKTNLHLLWFQSSAAHSQACAAGFVQAMLARFFKTSRCVGFPRIAEGEVEKAFAIFHASFVKIWHNPRQTRELQNPTLKVRYNLGDLFREINDAVQAFHLGSGMLCRSADCDWLRLRGRTAQKRC